MTEFKRAGDVMVFECPAFKVEVVGDAEKLTITNEARSDEIGEILSTAFDTLDRMLEHKARQTRDLKVSEINFRVNVDTRDAEEAIRKLNEYVWKHSPAENMPGHRFREYMKRRGL